jgi:hypothetical protein
MSLIALLGAVETGLLFGLVALFAQARHQALDDDSLLLG